MPASPSTDDNGLQMNTRTMMDLPRSIPGPCSADVPGRLRLLLAGALLVCTAASQGATFTGLVYPIHDVTLSAGVSGIVSKRHVVPGQRVAARQPLIALDDQIQTIESNRRKAMLDDDSEVLAARDRVRILGELFAVSKNVFDRTGSVSKDELLRLEAELIASRGRLDQLQAQKQREKLEFQAAEQERQLRHYRAPLMGTVSRIFPEVGEWVKPGDPLLHLVDVSTGVLQLTVPLQVAQDLRKGMPMPIRFETHPNDPPTIGKIDFVSPVADPASGLVVVKVHFANRTFRIRPGVKGVVDLGVAPAASKSPP
jgi:RND family efflux transporter MFP subunit